MLTRLEIRQELASTGIKVTSKRVDQIASQIGYAVKEVYEDDEAIAIMTALQAKSQTAKTTAKPADSSALTRSMERSESGISNAFSSQIEGIKNELMQAKQQRDQFAKEAASALVTVIRETKPLIYHLAAQELAEDQLKEQQSFSFGGLFLESVSSFSNEFGSEQLALPCSEAYAHANAGF